MDRTEHPVHVKRVVKQNRANLDSQVLDAAFAELLAKHCSSSCFCSLCRGELAAGSKPLNANKLSTVVVPQTLMLSKL